MRLAGHLSVLQNDWNAALDWIESAANSGSSTAQAELAVMSPDDQYIESLISSGMRGQRAPADCWAKLRQSIDVEALTLAPASVERCPDPFVITAAHMASPKLCRWVMATAAPRLRRALVTQAGKAEPFVDPNRSNKLCIFNFDMVGLPILALRQRIANLAGVPVSHLEDTTVLQYGPGEQFSEHHDAFDLDDEDIAGGQRRQTLLVYLNEDYEGGETEFPALPWRFRGRPGEALLWVNTDERQVADPRTRHAGLPPRTGEKWIMSQWILDRPAR